MCLAVPGRIIDLNEDTPFTRTGQVEFGGVVRLVNLTAVPEAKVGDYVLVHAGLAISLVCPEEAMRTIEYLSRLENTAENEEDWL